MRLNRFLAAAGLGSRRACDELIRASDVVLNGTKVEKLATNVEPGDDVRVRGRRVQQSQLFYVLLNKPRGFVVTRSDERGRRTIYDLLPPEFANLSHVGRLDKESEGLLILTNDGKLSQRLTHPSHEIEKEYEVTLDRAYDPVHTPKLIKGIFIEGGRGRFERVHMLAAKVIRVILRQGIKRQIRLMMYDLGYEVERLARTRIGAVKDTRLFSGGHRQLTARELESLVSAKPAPRKKSDASASSTPKPTPKPRARPKRARPLRPTKTMKPRRSTASKT